jgi:hypothetical protein
MSYRGDITAVNAVTNTDKARNLKVWAGTVQSTTSGAWSVDLRASGFSHIFSVTATAQFDASSAANVPIAGVRTFSTQQATGWVVQSNNFTFFLGGGGSGLKFCTTPTTIHVQVIGD